MDVVPANEITLLNATLRQMRLEISELHFQWYSEAEALASSVDVVP
jgi:hypothetical protein